MLTATRYLLFALGIFLGFILLIVLYLSWGVSISRIGIVYLAGYFLIVAGLIASPWWPRRGLTISLAGIVILILSMGLRILFPASGTQMNLVTLPGGTRPRLPNRIFDEQDMVLFGAKIAPSVGFVSQREYQSLIPNLLQTYREMDKEGVTPLSPVFTTYLNLQRPDQFDALVTEPGSKESDTGIIFLHGYGGNFTLQCWLIAKAANLIDTMTLCPSTDPSGQWWQEQGTAILQESIDYLHQRGIKHIYLAGLSNGGIGASRLAHRFKDDLSGLILISGADPNAEITGLPVLVIHGLSDERIPATIAQEFATASAPNSAYMPFPGDHFLLLKEAPQIEEVIVNWLLEQKHQSSRNIRIYRMGNFKK